MSEIVCPNCQSRQPAEAVFCDNCGYSLASPGTVTRSDPALTPAFLTIDPDNPPPGMQTCGACGTLNLPEARFCDQCGARLGERTEPRAYTGTRTLVEGSDPYDDTLWPPNKEQPAIPAPGPYVTGRLTLEPTGARLDFPPGCTEIFVGREDPISNIFPEVDLTPHGGEAAGVSRRHARFSLAAGLLMLEDLDSTNFTFINRKRVMPGTRQPVRNGDELRFGRITARYEEI